MVFVSLYVIVSISLLIISRLIDTITYNDTNTIICNLYVTCDRSSSWDAYTGLPPDTESQPEPPGQGMVMGLPDDEEGHQPMPQGMMNDDPLTCEIQADGATILRAKVCTCITNRT